MSNDLTLVRCWRGYDDERPGAFVDWRDGEFEIRGDEPMAAELWSSMSAHRDDEYLLTVYSTDELIWNIDSMTLIAGFSYKVRCTPHVRRLRAALASDEYLAEVWLRAEKRHHEKTLAVEPRHVDALDENERDAIWQYDDPIWPAHYAFHSGHGWVYSTKSDPIWRPSTEAHGMVTHDSITHRSSTGEHRYGFTEITRFRPGSCVLFTHRGPIAIPDNMDFTWQPQLADDPA